MGKRLLLILMVVGTTGLVAVPGHAGITVQTDPANDVIDPVICQNEQTCTNPTNGQRVTQSIPSADIKAWQANFTGSSLIITMDIGGRIPKHDTVSPTPQLEAPPGFVGASYRLFFTSSPQSLNQRTGYTCAAYSDNHVNHLHQNESTFAECTEGRIGPLKSPNWKIFVGYGARESINSAGQFQNEGDVEWGFFDAYGQALGFNSMKADEPCTKGAGYVIGGGVREGTATPCSWGAQVQDGPGSAGPDDRVVIRVPYVPTWVNDNDQDDNAVHIDENRSYEIARLGGSATGVIATTWVDQVAGLPEPLCDPTAVECTTDATPENCFDAVDPFDPVPGVGPAVACTQTEANEAAADLSYYVQHPTDCSPPNAGGQRAPCIQEIGGFTYLADWGGRSVGNNPNDAYTLGLFSWPVPGYVPSPQCRYQYAVPFITGGRMPDGVFVATDPNRQTGYSGVILTYGLRIHSDDEWGPPTALNPNGPRPGHTNVRVPPGTLPSTTVDNPVPSTFIANPLINDGACSYTPFIGARFVEAEGATVAT